MRSAASGPARSAAEESETADRGQFRLLGYCQNGIESRFGLATGVKDLALNGFRSRQPFDRWSLWCCS